jgi:LDH2 family malate/lactate/ureidoglycolate dehydrogenase
MGIAIEKAKKVGIGMVSLFKTNHFGAAAYTSMLAQKEDMIGETLTNATPRMAPTGGKTIVYG